MSSFAHDDEDPDTPEPPAAAAAAEIPDPFVEAFAAYGPPLAGNFEGGMMMPLPSRPVGSVAASGAASAAAAAAASAEGRTTSASGGGAASASAATSSSRRNSLSSTGTGTSGGGQQRRRCAVEGCGKQSQGGRNRNMCRSHFRQWYLANHPGGVVPGDRHQSKNKKKKKKKAAGGGAIMDDTTSSNVDQMLALSYSASAEYSAAGTTATDNASVSTAGSGSILSTQQRTRCSVAGCNKQSQGKRCNGMCAAHFKKYGNTPTAAAAAAAAGVAGIGGAMAMAAATMADMNHSMDNMSVSTLGTAGSITTSGGGGGGGGGRKKRRCSVAGCPKQSQGRIKNFMCAAHFLQRGSGTGAEGNAGGDGVFGVTATGGAADPARRRKKRSNYNVPCSIRKCSKQSQGGRCNFMCAGHFRQYGKNPPSSLYNRGEKNDEDEDEDDVEEDEYESESDDDDDDDDDKGDEFAYEQNNGYYAFSPGNNDYALFVHGVDNDAARGGAASLAADAYDPSLMHSLEPLGGGGAGGEVQLQPQHLHDMPPLIGYGRGQEAVAVTGGMLQMSDEDAAAAAVAASAVQISREAAAAAAAAEAAAAPSTPGEGGRRAHSAVLNSTNVLAGSSSVGDRARSIVNAMEAGHRGSHWNQIQSIHNGRSGGKPGPVDRRRRADMEMERARQLAAEQPQQEEVQKPTDVVGGVGAGRIGNDGDGTGDDVNDSNCGSDSSSDGNNDNDKLPPSPLTPRHASGIPTEVQCRTPIIHAGITRKSTTSATSANSEQPVGFINSPDLFLSEFVIPFENGKDRKDDILADFDMSSPGPRTTTSEAAAARSGPAEGASRQDMKTDEHFEKDKEHGGCWEFGGDQSGNVLGDVLGSPLHQGTPSRSSSVMALDDTAAPQRTKLSFRNKKKQGRPSTLPEIDELHDIYSSSEEAHGGDNVGKTSSKNHSDGLDVSLTVSRRSSKRTLSAANEATAVKSHFEQVQGRRKQDPFAFEQTSGASTASDSKTSKPPMSPRRYGSPSRAQDEQILSPSRRRKRRLDKQIDHAKKVAASPAASVLGSAAFASPSGSMHEEETEHVDFAERLSRVNLTTERGPMSPHHLSTKPPGPLQRNARYLASSDLPHFEILSSLPPRRTEYPNQKSFRKQSGHISSSLTTLGSSAATSGPIHFLNTLGRCHIAENDECGFRWYPKGSTWEQFVASEFVGYNQGLGRVYFKSFVHRGRKIEVGNFVKKRYGNTTEYYRIAGVFQATMSFVGDWEDGSFPPEGRRNPHKGEIQKRGHPYLIVVPLKPRSDVVSDKARKRMIKKARRRPSSAASDSESDAGFTSCDSDDGGGGRLGITNKKRRLPGGGSKSAYPVDQVEKELVLTKEELEEPNNIFVLPMWLGEPRVTFETISVRCKSERGEEWIIKATDHGGSGSKKRHRARNGETFVCRQAMNQSQWDRASLHKRKKKRRSDLKEPKVNRQVEMEEDGLLTKYLADEQFQLLTAKPKELLEDFIPPQWAYSFNACKTQFIQSWEERPWYDDKSNELDFYPYPDGSSDDSDGFDEESNAVLRGEIALSKQLDVVSKMLDHHCDGLLKKSEGTAGRHDIDTSDAGIDEEIMEEEPKRTPAPELGEGWTVTLTSRKSGATKGKQDKTWHSPCGQEFRSIVQVKKFKAEQSRQRRKSSTKKKSAGGVTKPTTDANTNLVAKATAKTTEDSSKDSMELLSKPSAEPASITPMEKSMEADSVKKPTAEPAEESMQGDSITKPTTKQSKPTTKPTEASTKTDRIAEPVIEPAKPINMSAVPKERPVDIDSKISIDDKTPDDDRDSDELDKIVTIVHDVDSTCPVEDAAAAGGEPADNTGAAHSLRCITIDDLKRNVEALYAAAAPGQKGTLSRSTMIKQVAHLQKICDKPNIEEALPHLFLHKTATDGNLRTVPSSEDSTSSHYVPSYAVERKDSTEQIAARVAYVMRHYERSNSSSRPKALFYCLKATYAKTMAVKLRKAGVNASAYSRSSIAGFSGDSIDVLCLGGDAINTEDGLPYIDFIFHISVPASLKSYAQETMLATKHRSASLCILFYRYTDLIETRKSLGLSKLKDDSTHVKEERALNEVLVFVSNGSACRGSILLEALGDKAPSLRCGGAECCDNCRFRLGLHSSLMALKDDSKTVSMGSAGQDVQHVENCYLDITSYVLEALAEAKVTTGSRAAITKVTLNSAFANVWDNGDVPSSTRSLSTSEWDRISPIRGICLKTFLRRHLYHLLLERGVISPPTTERRHSLGIDRYRLAAFVADAKEGRIKIVVHNVRLFQSYLDVSILSNEAPAEKHSVLHPALPSFLVPLLRRETGIKHKHTTAATAKKDDGGDTIMQDASPTSLPATTGKKDDGGDTIMQDASPTSLPATIAKASSTEHAVDADELIQELLEFDKLIAQYDQQDESDLPVTKEELKAIDKGATFFPRLTIPLRSLSWMKNLPYLVQYEIWRLWNTAPRNLTTDQLFGPIRSHVENNPAITPREMCIHIHAVANDNSVQKYADILESDETSGSELGLPIIFSAILQSTGDKLSLQPPTKAGDCRVYRKFGSSRFLRVLLPNKFLGAGSQLFHTSPHGFDESGAMLTTPLYVAGRYYRYLFPDLASNEKSLVFFAERGAGISKEKEMTVGHVREWCIPKKLNSEMTVVDEQVGMSICFAPSVRSCLLPRGSVSIEEGPSHDANGLKFNGGCGRISRAALDLVWSSWSTSDNAAPVSGSSRSLSSFEGAIGGMKGVWVLDESLGDEIQVVCRPSQQLFKLPMKSLASPPSSTSSPDDAYDKVEVHKWDGIDKQGVRCRFIQAIEYRGVPSETLRSCVEMACSDASASSLEAMRADKEYPLEKCRIRRLIPDHTGLLKAGEAFFVTHGLPFADEARNVIVFPEDPVHGDDIVKLKLVGREVLHDRDLAAASTFCKFFDGIQSGIVIGKGSRDPSERAGGECFGRIQVCLLEQIVNKIDEASSAKDGRARQLPRPRVDDLCLRQLYKEAETNDSDDTIPGQYLFRKLKQDWFLAQMQDLLTILNDLKGPNSVETMKIAAVVDALAKHPYHTYELGCLEHGIKASNIHCPDWFCNSLKHPNHSGLYIPSRILDTNRYRSTSANGILFKFLGKRINEAARDEQDESKKVSFDTIRFDTI